MSTFDSLIADLTRDVDRAQPRDVLQFCASWFQSRLEEQRVRTRDLLVRRSPSLSADIPLDFYVDTPTGYGSSPAPPHPVSPFSQAATRSRSSIPSVNFSHASSPFGTLNVPGNALLSYEMGSTNGYGNTSPLFHVDTQQPTSPLTTDRDSFARYESFSTPTILNSSLNPGDYLHPPTSAIYERRASVSAESIDVDSGHDEPLPTFPKTADQLQRIKQSITNNFIFRDLDEEQERGVLNAMQERRVEADEVVILQGDVGDYFYVVEAGLLHCYIHPGPLPASWQSEGSKSFIPDERFMKPKHHPIFGREVAVCKANSSFGELALMYGHPRAATVLSVETSTLWCLDRITFRTIILKAAHRRRTMYESFLSSVSLLSSLEAEERSKVADALVSSVYPDGEAVVRQGEMGDTFFFVEEGEAVVTKTQPGEDGELRDITVGRLAKGDYFGELALLRLEPRAATVSAWRRTDPSQSKLKVAALDAPAFTRLLGPLREIMERKAGENYGIPTRLTR